MTDITSRPTPTDRSERIADLNDKFRRGSTGGRLMLTAGVIGLEGHQVDALMTAVREFDDFSEGDDPYGEHDFGAIDLNDERYFWKIDYYDLDMRMASPDPTNPEVTCRVMTVMRADEY